MAITKIKPIRGTVNKALAYILDPQKTDDHLYVSSYGCAASDAAAKEFEWTRNLAAQQGMQMPNVIARHLIQSFAFDEVTPEQAHEIGKQFADEWLKGKYEYVIATHIDKGHCHNHIISRIFVDGLELRLGLQNDCSGDFPASDGSYELIELRNLTDVRKLIEQTTDMNRKSAVVDIICLVTKQIEHLGVHNCHDEIEGVICIGDDYEQSRFPVSECVQLHLIIAHQLTEFRDVKGSKPSTTGDQNAFGRLARDELSRTF